MLLLSVKTRTHAGLGQLNPGNLHVVLTSADAAALALSPEVSALQRDMTLPKVRWRPECSPLVVQIVSVQQPIAERADMRRLHASLHDLLMWKASVEHVRASSVHGGCMSLVLRSTTSQ